MQWIDTMFTGIIEEIGTVARVERAYPVYVLTVMTDSLTRDMHTGDSIAVDGVCFTVVRFDGTSFQTEVQEETVRRTIVSHYRNNTPVNLERALTPTSRMGGHYVQGHCDGTGTVTSWHQQGRDWVLKVKVPPGIRKYIVEKGFIAVNGISLTVASLSHDCSIHVIPHTRANTTLQYLRSGEQVNLEVDIMAKYVESVLT